MTALFENIIITYSEKGQRVCTLYLYIYMNQRSSLIKSCGLYIIFYEKKIHISKFIDLDMWRYFSTIIITSNDCIAQNNMSFLKFHRI